MRKHDDILPVCDERFVIKDKLLTATWIVGIAFISGLSAVFGMHIKKQSMVEKTLGDKIEAVEMRVPNLDSKMDKIISQNDEIIRINRLNRIRSGIER